MSKPSRNGRALPRLTQPLVRDNGVAAARHLGRGARPRGRGVPAQPRGARAGRARHLQLLEVHQRGELPGAEAGARGVRHEQHRQLQPNLTRPQRRRSGDGLRCGRRHQLVPRGGGDGRRLPVGLERARGAPDLVPSPAQGHPERGTRLYVMDPRRTASAQWADVWMGLNIGSDIALANAMAREIIHAGLTHEAFIAQRDLGLRRVSRRRSSPTRSSAGSGSPACPRTSSARRRTPSRGPTRR